MSWRGLRGKAPIACDLPRRSSVRLCAPPHAATVVAHEYTGLDVGTEDSILGAGAMALDARQGSAMSTEPSIRENLGLDSSIGHSFSERDGHIAHA